MYKTNEQINKMSQRELTDYAAELGAESHETFLETACRLEDSGEKQVADVFRLMDERWYELEG